MVFNVNKSDEQKNTNVLLELKLPDDKVYKYAVKRLTRSQMISLKVKGKKSQETAAETGVNLVAKVMADIEPLDRSIEFTELLEKLSEINDDAVEDLSEHVIGLATKSFEDLKNDGEHIW